MRGPAADDCARLADITDEAFDSVAHHLLLTLEELDIERLPDTAGIVASHTVNMVILGIGLNQVRRRLTNISNGLGTLGGALATVESQHLRGLSKWVAGAK